MFVMSKPKRKQKVKLYKVSFGNGFGGSRSNLGDRLVIACNAGDARKCISISAYIPLVCVGRAQAMQVLIADNVGLLG